MTVIVITGAGFIVNPHITEYLSNSDNQEDKPDQIYSMEFDFHDVSAITTDVESLSIQYIEYNSSLIFRPDPYFTGIITTKYPNNQNIANQNESLWKTHVFQGFRYNKWNVAEKWGSHQPEINVSNSYILYEVDLFSKMIISATFNAQEANTSLLEYNLTDQDPEEIYNRGIPEKWIANYRVDFTNGTSLRIEAHKDGWFKYNYVKCETWLTQEDGTEYCYSGYGTSEVFKDFTNSFTEFHETFSIYVKNHIKIVN
ncbi:MAG: hypothetical protein HeimC3_49880 [Candidatus Heimdallarchaeota archaeon LC_3]|nr:MAG: hypothetical protein HeimC3_49880 [Candidatus Heimdallarchaeota archaeon LC_3]